MKIDGTSFGEITIDGVSHDYDVVIRLSGEIVKRKKKLSKKFYGTSHTISGEEMEFVLEEDCDLLVVGAGQYGEVELSPEAEAMCREAGCKVILEPTPQALKIYNKSPGHKIGLFHVTC